LDLRNSGKNIPSSSPMGYFEKHGVKAAVDCFYQQKQMHSVGIFGVSMGAETSIMQRPMSPKNFGDRPVRPMQEPGNRTQTILKSALPIII
jgi:hypothetical protein